MKTLQRKKIQWQIQADAISPVLGCLRRIPLFLQVWFDWNGCVDMIAQHPWLEALFSLNAADLPLLPSDEETEKRRRKRRKKHWMNITGAGIQKERADDIPTRMIKVANAPEPDLLTWSGEKDIWKNKWWQRKSEDFSKGAQVVVPRPVYSMPIRENTWKYSNCRKGKEWWWGRRTEAMKWRNPGEWQNLREAGIQRETLMCKYWCTLEWKTRWGPNMVGTVDMTEMNIRHHRGEVL